ncbi:uncharacterized protein LOC5515947 isoform X2 [Nematostella vectensis]|uniref:uncharacterized protein LOC5515947 isoform X2 n=1 Tax=Nematostella vectensis TaxID=45351 RepID=UPI002076DD94|nr:uncharacterized protein LOC5515947 isoform X2 [Nematostella vectensis]
MPFNITTTEHPSGDRIHSRNVSSREQDLVNASRAPWHEIHRGFPSRFSKERHGYTLSTVKVLTITSEDDSIGVLLPLVCLALFLFSAAFAFRCQRRRERKYRVSSPQRVSKLGTSEQGQDYDALSRQKNSNGHRRKQQLKQGGQNVTHLHRPVTNVVPPPLCTNCRIEKWRQDGRTWCHSLGDRPNVGACANGKLPYRDAEAHVIKYYATPNKFVDSPELLSSVFFTPESMIVPYPPLHGITPAPHHAMDTCSSIHEDAASETGWDDGSPSSVANCACRLITDKVVEPNSGIPEVWV